MEKEINKENVEDILENADIVEESEPALEENFEEIVDEIKNPPQNSWKAYVPRFTEASERYRVKGDSRIRERLGSSSTDIRKCEILCRNCFGQGDVAPIN